MILIKRHHAPSTSSSNWLERELPEDQWVELLIGDAAFSIEVVEGIDGNKALSIRNQGFGSSNGLAVIPVVNNVVLIVPR